MARGYTLLALVGVTGAGCTALFPFADSRPDGADPCVKTAEVEPNDSEDDPDELCARSFEAEEIEVESSVEDHNPSEDWFRLVVPPGHDNVYVETDGPGWGSCELETVIVLYVGVPDAPRGSAALACTLPDRCTAFGVGASACGSDCDGCDQTCASADVAVAEGDEVYIRIISCTQGAGRYLLFAS